MEKSLVALTIKPIMRCNANCHFCSERLEYYSKATRNKLTLSNWKEVINDSIVLGVASISLSGGEPTLYGDLFSLIEYCKERNLEVHLKTNGYLINNDFAKRLAKSNVDSCTISLYSFDPNIHDEIKNLKGSHKKAVDAIRFLRNYHVSTNAQVVLTEHILNKFDEYLGWVIGLGIDTLFISYLEGSCTEKPNEEAIKFFINNIMPKAKDILGSKQTSVDLLESLSKLDVMYNFNNISVKEMARGIYNKDMEGCGRNHSLAIILENGDIHPCNAVEYFHKPIVGNINNQSLLKAWSSSKEWEMVKKNGLDWCQKCPMNRHFFLKLSQKNIPNFYSTPNEK